MRPVVAVVVTTVQSPTTSLRRLEEVARSRGAVVIVVGDTKTPQGFDLPGAEFLSFKRQISSGGPLAESLPRGHYSRKNLGYLRAIEEGVGVVYETDDDNVPLAGWSIRAESVEAVACRRRGWINSYAQFTSEPIWPRGLPLDAVGDPSVLPETGGGGLVSVRAPVQQGLANGEPDVDAVWRLVMRRAVTFRAAPSLFLGQGAWCPFNSQSTWWFPVAFPLLYLPSFCSFRMTDIWRSFIAQRCVWELGMGIVFHGAEVFQERNVHNLMRDFEQEVPGYLGNRRIASILGQLTLSPGEENVGHNLLKCYEALILEGVFPESEARLVRLWLQECKGALPKGKP